MVQAGDELHGCLCLPLYEGVDWNSHGLITNLSLLLSPSLRGSGLKFSAIQNMRNKYSVSLFTREWIEINTPIWWYTTAPPSPSLRGSGLKWCKLETSCTGAYVSLFTREWIEIPTVLLQICPCCCLPLYEGVDWNDVSLDFSFFFCWSPSLRGSGLKSSSFPA